MIFIIFLLYCICRAGDGNRPPALCCSQASMDCLQASHSDKTYMRMLKDWLCLCQWFCRCLRLSPVIPQVSPTTLQLSIPVIYRCDTTPFRVPRIPLLARLFQRQLILALFLKSSLVLPCSSSWYFTKSTTPPHQNQPQKCWSSCLASFKINKTRGSQLLFSFQPPSPSHFFQSSVYSCPPTSVASQFPPSLHPPYVASPFSPSLPSFCILSASFLSLSAPSLPSCSRCQQLYPQCKFYRCVYETLYLPVIVILSCYS